MNHTARMTALENKVNALMLIIEKQNESIGHALDHMRKMTDAINALEQRKAVVTSDYVPQFTQWPKGV